MARSVLPPPVAVPRQSLQGVQGTLSGLSSWRAAPDLPAGGTRSHYPLVSSADLFSVEGKMSRKQRRLERGSKSVELIKKVTYVLIAKIRLYDSVLPMTLPVDPNGFF